ncbi:protein takeout-like [Maniola hyperantus]|uniref:protein takeout-like n=1 Tax=Aphantopus hyperantus TaxID=2795564 RepID=UPI003747C059
MKHIVLLLLICLQIAYIYPTILTNPFRCFIWDTACVTALAQNIGSGYIPRIPELAAADLDPLEIDIFSFEKDGVLLEIKDTKVHGLKNLIIDELRSYSNLSLAHIVFRTDLLYTGFYKVNGSIFFQPINGEGGYWSSLKNVEIELFIPYDIVKNAKGVEFIEASNYNFRFDVKDNAQFHFDNLYYGDIERSELMHYLLNQHWKFVTTQYGRAVISNLVDSIAKEYKSYFRLVPLKLLVEY